MNWCKQNSYSADTVKMCSVLNCFQQPRAYLGLWEKDMYCIACKNSLVQMGYILFRGDRRILQ